jgi:ribA/ribD-fused uncharacterized protein
VLRAAGSSGAFVVRAEGLSKGGRMIWNCGGQRWEGCVVVFRVREEFGGLSNMSNEFPLRVAGLAIGSSEALYQSCRYPRRPDWQREILDAPHAMPAKMKAKKECRRQQSRPDWPDVQINIMRWVLRVKLAQHLRRFGGLLLSSGSRPIVERSRKDRSWGAVPDANGALVGANWLGRLLMELREELVVRRAAGEESSLLRVEPLAIPEMCLLGQEIGVIEAKAVK